MKIERKQQPPLSTEGSRSPVSTLRSAPTEYVVL